MQEALRSKSVEDIKITKKTEFKVVQNVTYEVPEKNVLSESVSAHVPLHRFIAGLFPLFNNFSDGECDESAKILMQVLGGREGHDVVRTLKSSVSAQTKRRLTEPFSNTEDDLMRVTDPLITAVTMLRGASNTHCLLLLNNCQTLTDVIDGRAQEI